MWFDIASNAKSCPTDNGSSPFPEPIFERDVLVVVHFVDFILDIRILPQVISLTAYNKRCSKFYKALFDQLHKKTDNSKRQQKQVTYTQLIFLYIKSSDWNRDREEWIIYLKLPRGFLRSSFISIWMALCHQNSSSDAPLLGDLSFRLQTLKPGSSNKSHLH